MKKAYSSQIARYDSKGAFVEILNCAFSIQKLQLNFCTYNTTTNTQTKKLPIYMDIGKALLLSSEIKNNFFQMRVKRAKSKGTYKNTPITDYTSFFEDMGGINEDRVNAKFGNIKKSFPWAEQGKSISRQFKIQAGKKAAWILRVEYGFGKSSDKGLIVPEGKPTEYINIPVTNENLKEMAILIETHYNAYLNQFYSKHSQKLFPSDDCNVFEAKSS